jgi:hypothetical protein
MLENMEWYSVMCCIGLSPNTTLCVQVKRLTALPHFLQYYKQDEYFVANRMHIVSYLYSVQGSLFSLCQLLWQLPSSIKVGKK